MDNMNNIKNIKFLLLLVIISISVFGGLITYELHESNMQRKSEFSRIVNNDFFENATDTLVLRLIDDHKTILKRNGGMADEYDMDEYLGRFENIKNYLDAGSLNPRDVYNNYAHYVEAAYNDTEVINYIHEIRKTNKDLAYFTNFERLAVQMSEIDKKLKK